jgi:hypothetical protein
LGARPGYVTGTVDQELLARNEYLTAENRILKPTKSLSAHVHRQN